MGWRGGLRTVRLTHDVLFFAGAHALGAGMGRISDFRFEIWDGTHKDSSRRLLQ
jgi:hypothetical protein